MKWASFRSTTIPLESLTGTNRLPARRHTRITRIAAAARPPATPYEWLASCS